MDNHQARYAAKVEDVQALYRKLYGREANVAQIRTGARDLMICEAEINGEELFEIGSSDVSGFVVQADTNELALWAFETV